MVRAHGASPWCEARAHSTWVDGVVRVQASGTIIIYVSHPYLGIHCGGGGIYGYVAGEGYPSLDILPFLYQHCIP